MTPTPDDASARRRSRGAAPGPLRALRGVALQLTLAAAATFALGVALGYLSRDLFVIGLLPLLLGVGAGAAVSFVALLNGGPWRLPALAAAFVAITAGWAAFQVMEDHHFEALFREQVARAQAVGDSLPLSLLEGPDTTAFLSRDAERLLEEAAIAQVGRGGALGRWLMRADRGVRLVGPMVGGRALPVGQGGAIVWAALELALATLFAALVLRRARRALIARSEAGAGLGERAVS